MNTVEEHPIAAERSASTGSRHPGAEHDHDPIPNDLPKVGNGAVIVLVIVAILLFAGLFVIGIIPNRQRLADAKKIADAQSDTPMVEVVQPYRAKTLGELVLPGDAWAMQQASLYPRTNGYLKRLLVDIGDHVKAGQLLAEIDTPEVDAQLNQARASLDQTRTGVTKADSDLALAQTTLNRYESVGATGAITQQDIDEKRATFKQAQAALEAARANVVASQADVQRLTELQGFEKITAPFTGVITARNYDVGALLSATNSGQPLFELEETDVLRVFVNVPAPDATAVHEGQQAKLDVRNFPGRVFTGKVTRTAGAIDLATRTLRTQIDFPNPDGTLLAGLYGQIHLPITPSKPPLTIPTSAMIFQADGTKVATVENGRVKFRKITIGRDLGTEMEITSGLSGDEQIIKSPGERLADGLQVQVVEAPDSHPAPAADKTRTALK